MSVVTSPENSPGRRSSFVRTLCSPTCITVSILILYCFYAAIFIYRTSFMVGSERYFCLFDDAMISMRYARHLAQGFGLVFNTHAAPVAGFTNPLWVILMAIIHLLPISFSKMSLAVQVMSALMLLGNLVLVKKIAADIFKSGSIGVAASLLFTAFYLPLNNWALQGMEVGALALLVTGAAWALLRDHSSQRVSAIPYLLLSVAVLIRLDMILLSLTVVAFMFLSSPTNRPRILLVGLTPILAAVGLQLLFQYIYFGDWLPNTYYLKMTGYPVIPRILRGLYVTGEFAIKINPLLLLVPLVLWFIRGDLRVALVICLMATQTLYSVYVGGDAWEWWGGSNRFVAVVMPLFFVTVGIAIEYAWRFADNFLASTGRTRTLAVIGSAIIIGVVLVNANAIYGVDALSEWLLIKKPLHTKDNQMMVERAALLERITEQDASVAVDWAGVIPYFTNRPTVDLLGKTDRVIAHQPMRINPDIAHFTKFYPGHLKWDFSYSIGQLNPDVVVPLWKSLEEAKPYLLDKYKLVRLGRYQMFLRSDSHNIRWPDVSRLAG